MLILKKNKAATAVEYMALIIFLLGALLIFRKYILRGMWSQWKKAGDVFGYGKQYDPRLFGGFGEGGGTLKCLYVYTDLTHDPETAVGSAGSWVDQDCYDECIMRNDGADCVAECNDSSPEHANVDRCEY